VFNKLHNMMLPYACPVEIWLRVLTFLFTRDIIVLSHTCKHLYAIAEDVRQKRQDIHRLLSKFVDDDDGFRQLMKKMGGIIVGDMALAFFTGANLGEVSSLDVVLYDVDLESCGNSWFSFLKGETIASGGRFARYSLNQKVCS
jgi:F-box domain